MSRRARLSLPNIPLHVIHRGNNHQSCFFSEDDYLHYLGWLKEYSEKFECSVHAYVLQEDHVHLLLSAAHADGPAHFMKLLGQRYTQYINRLHGRSGTLWEGRYRSSLLQEELYLLECQHYIEQNPVRAGLVAEPAAYQWSSYTENASGKPGAPLTAHRLYLELGNNKAERCTAYRALLAQPLNEAMVERIRHATNGNYALGDDEFVAEIAAVLGRRVVPGKAGRPRKQGAAESIASE